jgi:hypothetical protein
MNDARTTDSNGLPVCVEVCSKLLVSGPLSCDNVARFEVT